MPVDFLEYRTTGWQAELLPQLVEVVDRMGQGAVEIEDPEAMVHQRGHAAQDTPVDYGA